LRLFGYHEVKKDSLKFWVLERVSNNGTGKAWWGTREVNCGLVIKGVSPIGEKISALV